MNEQIKNLGTVIKNLKPLHTTEYEVIFNLHENAFFQKLVPFDIVERVRIRPEDYFKGLLFLSYYTKIITDKIEVCDNLEEISKRLRDSERARGLDRGESFLSSESVVYETGLYSNEEKLKLYSSDNTINEDITYRYLTERKIDEDDIVPADCFYNALGKRVYDLVRNENKKYLDNVKRRTDLWSVVFTDTCLGFSEAFKVKDTVHKELDSLNYLNASVIAFSEIQKASTLNNVEDSIKRYISKLR